MELRSSLVVEAGHAAEGGKTVPFYQFRHLTFQEYLAAVAAVEGHHPGYKQRETLVDPLGSVIIADEWKEVIPMAAVLGRKQAQPLIAELVSLGEAIKTQYLLTGSFANMGDWVGNRKLPNPISRLAQCLVEEAEFSQETLPQTLSLVSFFARGCLGAENWRALSCGPYSAELIHQALVMYMSMDWPHETWLRNTVAVLSALSCGRSSPYDGFNLVEVKTAIMGPNDNDAALALLTLCGFMWGPSDELPRTRPVSLKVNGRRRGGSGFLGYMLALLPEVEASVMSRSAGRSEAAKWALGLLHGRAGRQRATIASPSNAVVDHITAAWLDRDREVETVDSFTLASALLSTPRGSWRPQLSEAERESLRDYLVIDPPGAPRRRRDMYASVAAALIGIHAENLFSPQELSKLLSPGFVRDDKRLPALLMSIGLDLSDLKSASKASAEA